MLIHGCFSVVIETPNHVLYLQLVNMLSTFETQSSCDPPDISRSGPGEEAWLKKAGQRPPLFENALDKYSNP